MNVVFCTTCKGRTQHLEKTLPKNMHDNPNAKFVLVDYGSQDHLQDWLRENQPHWEEQLTVYSYIGYHPFKMAHAKNMAHRCAMLEGADVLVNLDADNFTGPGFVSYLDHNMTEFPGSFMWARMIKDDEGRLPRGISGRIAVSKHAFLNAGGYDEKFDTWGPDDKDFTARLKRLGYQAREINGRFLQAIMHTDKLRFREYRHAEGIEYDDMQLWEQDTTVVNFGKIGCGTVYRNFNFSTPIELKLLPTRIFGIGMHKTATTSLHTALLILGFDSAHWKTARWAKHIWKEMMEGGRSNTLERHYALCDLPITFLYRELDKAYPGSKFILTVRDERKWIESVRNHWDHDKNPFRKNWNDDPFTHRAHRLLYGQKGFDAELFLNRYRRHNAEVREHFKDRPADLLVMDMDLPPVRAYGPLGWYTPKPDDAAILRRYWWQLCAFLDCHLPNVPYPMEFRTKGGK